MPITIDGAEHYTQAEALEALGVGYVRLWQLATPLTARRYIPARDAIITRRYLHEGSAAYYLRGDVDAYAARKRRPGNKPGWNKGQTQ